MDELNQEIAAGQWWKKTRGRNDRGKLHRVMEATPTEVGTWTLDLQETKIPSAGFCWRGPIDLFRREFQRVS